MAKNDPEDLTIGYNADVLAAIKTIGQGLMALADALVAPNASSEQPKTRPARSRSQPSPVEDTSAEDDEPFPEEKDVKLSDLQGLAKDLIKNGCRPKLIEILEKHELENVSSAPVEKWKALKKDLEEAAA